MSTIAFSVHVQPEASTDKADLPRLGGALWQALQDYKKTCEGLEPGLAELADLSAVMSTVLSGRIEEAPDASGYVRLSEREARAILWVGLELESKIHALVEDFETDFGAARKAHFLARDETD